VVKGGGLEKGAMAYRISDEKGRRRHAFWLPSAAFKRIGQREM
jgi:hypothetical protein